MHRDGTERQYADDGRRVFPTYPLTPERCQWCPPTDPPCPVGATDAVLVESDHTDPPITSACLCHAYFARRVGVAVSCYDGSLDGGSEVVFQMLADADAAAGFWRPYEPPAAAAS